MQVYGLCNGTFVAAFSPPPSSNISQLHHYPSTSLIIIHLLFLRSCILYALTIRFPVTLCCDGSRRFHRLPASELLARTSRGPPSYADADVIGLKELAKEIALNTSNGAHPSRASRSWCKLIRGMKRMRALSLFSVWVISPACVRVTSSA